MDNLVLPKLEWEFKPEIHEEFLSLHNKVVEWTRKFCSDAGVNDKIDELKFTYCSARIWYYGSYERVLAISKLNTLFIILDDYYDVESAAWTLNKCKRILEIVEREEMVNLDGENWIEAAFSDVWQTVSSIAPNEWKQRFIEAVLNWHRAVVLELKFRNTKQIPSLVEYLTLRPFSTGSEVAFCWIEFAANKYVSVKSLSNPMLQALLQHCRYVFFATNDLCSIRKEVKDGDVMNAILVFQKEYNLSIQEAVNKTVDFIREELEMFICSKQQLRALYGEEFDFYLRGLESLMRGSYDYYLESKRY